MKVHFVKTSCCEIPSIVKNKNIDEIQQTLVQKKNSIEEMQSQNIKFIHSKAMIYERWDVMKKKHKSLYKKCSKIYLREIILICYPQW